MLKRRDVDNTLMARNRLAAVLLALWATVALSSRDPEPQGVIKGTGHTVGYGELAVSAFVSIALQLGVGSCARI